VTPLPPLILIELPLVVKLVPVRVTGTLRLPLLGCVAEDGLIDANVGAGGGVTVNATVLVFTVKPPITDRTPIVCDVPAPVDTLIVAVMVVEFTTWNVPVASDKPPVRFSPVAWLRLVPVRVTA